MPQAIVYCDRCGRIIPPGELDRGQGIVGGDVAVCVRCASDLTPEQRAALEQRARDGAPPPAQASAPGSAGAGPRPIERPSVAMRRRRASARAAESAGRARAHPGAGSSWAGVVIAGVAAGALVGVAIAVLVAFKPDQAGPGTSEALVEPPPLTLPLTPPPPAAGQGGGAVPHVPDGPPPPALATGESPAEMRLAEIKRDLGDPTLERHAEIRKALEDFPAAFPDAEAEAAEVKRLLLELESRYDEIARNAFDQAKGEASTLASGWRLADAAKALDAVGEKYGESEWFRKSGEAELKEAKEKIVESAREHAEADLELALVKFRQARPDGDFDAALKALKDRESFPEAVRERAAVLLKEIEGALAEKRKAEEEKQKRLADWREFLVKFHEAGRESAAKAKAFVEGRRAEFPSFRKAGFAERLRSLEACLREAALVEELADVGFNASGRTVRLTWKGQPVAGKPVTVRDGVLTLKRTVGGAIDIPLAELAPGDITRASGVARAKTGSPARAAAYLLVRGDLEGARKYAENIFGAKGTTLLDDIDAIAEATAPPPAPEEPAVAAVEPGPAPAPDPDLAAPSADPLLTKLVAWYKLDGDAQDSSGNDYHGTLSGTPTWKTGTIGTGSVGCRTGYIELPDIRSKFTDEATLSLWIKMDSAKGFYEGPFHFGTSGGTDYIRRTGEFYAKAFRDDVLAVWMRPPAGVPDRTTWHHMAITNKPGADNWKVYLNGAEVYSNTGEAAISLPANCRIGHGGSRHAKGDLDDVRVYSRALTAEEVKALFKGTELASARGEPGRVVTYTPPTEWTGPKPGASDGNPYLVDGKPRWRLDRIWPDDPMKAENYRPLVWKVLQSGPRWGADANSHDGQPGAVVRDSGVSIGVRTAWPGRAGKKLAALSFIAPARGTYSLKGTVTPGIFNANAPLGLRVLKIDRKSGEVSELAGLRLTSKVSTPLEKISVRLEEGQELALVPSFPGRGRVAANYAVKGLTVSARLVEFRRGLFGEYFAGRNPKPENRKATKIDPNIDFDWGAGSPDPELPSDGFSARWAGELEVPADGTYEFHVRRDDGARLWVDGKLVVDAWGNTSGESTGSAALRKGWLPFKFEFKEADGGASIRLSWKGPGGTDGADGVIPPERFRTPAPGSAAPAGAALAGAPIEAMPRGPEKPLPGETGKPGEWAPGLICEIFEGAGFNRRVGVRIDPNLSFDFGNSPPDLSLAGGTYTLRWRGWFLAPHDGEFTFLPEGVTVKLDGKELLSKKPIPVVRGLHELEAWATIRPGKGNARLQWDPSNWGIRSIEADRFFHKVPELGSMGPHAELVGGLKIEYFGDIAFRSKRAEGIRSSTSLDFGNLAPCTRCPQDRFSVRLSGYLLVSTPGERQFEFDVDDGGRFLLDGEVLIDARGKRPAKPPTVKKTLTGGYHKLTVEHFEKIGPAKVSLRWHGPGGRTHQGKPVFETIARDRFFMKPSEARVAARAGFAPGLNGAMFAGENLRGRSAMDRVDSSLLLSWGDRAPGPKVPKTFSAQWEGYLLAPRSGRFLFRARYNGGVRLYVHGRAEINKWTSGNDINRVAVSGPVALREGANPVVLQFVNAKGGALADLSWTGPDFAMRRIGGGDVVHKGDLASITPVAPKPAAAPDKPAPAPGAGADAGADAGATAKKPPAPVPPPQPGPLAKKPPAPVPPPWPGPLAEKPSEPLPEGNLVSNGGFEKVGENRFATGWRKWTDGGAQASVRTDKADAHGGGKSLSAKAFADGVKAGAWSTLAKTMPPGRYEVRFWACAEVGKARVGVTVAGRELGDDPVGEDWTQVKKQFELTAKQVRPSIRIYVTTPKVKVWIDDVEVEAAK